MAKTAKKETPKKAAPAAKVAAVSPIPESPLFFEKPEKFNQVNHSLTKIDSMGLVCGQQKYVADIDLPNLLHIKVLGSPHAHAVIKSIDVEDARKMPGVVAVFTYKDVPRIPRTTAGQGFPEPSPYDTYLLDSKVRFVGDRVAIVAAETPEAASEACTKIKVQYQVLKAVLDPEKARDKDAPIIHDEKDCRVPIPIFYDPKHNHCSHVETAVGDVKKGFKQADVVLEKTYYPHYAQHCPIEPHICIGYLDENDRLVLRTSTQVPFHARRITAQTLGIPVKKIRVIKPRIGGGFGTKQEVLLEDVCGLVALKTRRPCVWALTRAEEFMAARTRHPMVVTIQSGVKKNGTITAISMRIISNTGAYGSHGLTVLSNCGSKVLPLYRADNIEFIGDTVYTNLPVGGAYRGYGATQAAFAMECQMDEMAEAIGMDPIKFRQMNHIKEGESSPIFKALGEGREGVDMAIGSCGLSKCITEGMKHIDWAKKYGKPGNGTKRRGLGMCCLMQGSSIPEIDMGAVFIKMNEDGSFNMLLGATDLGTGSDTVLGQIAAETIGCKLTDMLVYSSDTDMTPFDVGAYASSTTYLTGGAVINCAKKVREQIVAVAASIMGEKSEDISIDDGICYGKGRKNKVTFGQVCNYAMYEHKQFQIGAIGSHISHASPPPFSAHFAEVEVDTETGEVKLLKYVAGVDCGTAINPQLADGQTQGACMNGISFALTEEYIFDENGRMLNPNFGNYKIWSTKDMPELVTFLVPTYEKTGPYGAKSVSEISINGALPAIGNAIKNAVGIRLTRPPYTAEKVLTAMKELNKSAKVTGKAAPKAASAAKAVKAKAEKPAVKAAKAPAKSAAPVKKAKK
ncbi:MAG TPA: molybdopterin-dependent oxidoreductase [Candidatus Rifleibacterium sp.]|nr:molybdopterin-dependent oxidoreductase [Candidatus Rifleibacterium sp.]HPT44305.1 molybdopterin-dependent oxidoreductase [Candidatus Rifleibacterium sp.]